MMKDKRTRSTLLVVGLACLAARAAANTDAEFIGSANALSAAAISGSQDQRKVAQIPTAPPAASDAPSSESVIRDETTEVEVLLDSTTVKCSAADYSAPMLKVLVPALADLTVFNHRNLREGAPCIAAGRCDGTLGPQSVLQSGDGTDVIPVRVVLKKSAQLQGDVCHVYLTETVTTEIRGVPFSHERSQEVASRTAEDCR